MPYSESDPDRRNLVLTSVIIILYYLAGGYLMNDIIKFPLIDLKFHNEWVLGVFVWVKVLGIGWGMVYFERRYVILEWGMADVRQGLELIGTLWGSVGQRVV